MEKREDQNRGIARENWLRCVSCSEASFTAHNRCAGIEAQLEEQASHLLSGGMMHQGNACGLLSGAILSAGMQAARRFEDDATRSAATLCVAIRLAELYPEISGSVNCREITGQSVISLSDKVRYRREGKARMCGRLLMSWLGHASQLIDDALKEFEEQKQPTNLVNCSTKSFKRFGSDAEVDKYASTYVAGLAGGVGLQGRSCAALTVGILILSLRHYAGRKSTVPDSRFVGTLHELGLGRFRKVPARLLDEFKKEFGSDLCSEIVGCKFTNQADHSSFIVRGGCSEIIDFVDDKVSEYG